MQLIVYTDEEAREGEEARQLLACYPGSTSEAQQLALVGLMQAIGQFSASFGAVRCSSCCKHICAGYR